MGFKHLSETLLLNFWGVYPKVELLDYAVFLFNLVSLFKFSSEIYLLIFRE